MSIEKNIDFCGFWLYIICLNSQLALHAGRLACDTVLADLIP